MKKLLAILLSLVCFCSILTSCGGSGGESSSESEKESSNQQVQEDGSITLMGFEDVNELLKSVAFTAYESKIELCDDEQYVTQGNYCAKMKLNQSLINNSSHYYDSTFQVLCNTQYLKRRDYSNVDYLAIDIYNATDYEVEFILSLGNRFNIVYDTVLKPGANPLAIYLNGEAYNFSAIDVWDFNFRGLKAEQSSLEIYVDNLRVYERAESVKMHDKKEDFATEKWYTFDNDRDAYLFWQFGTSESIFSMPRMTINRDKRYIREGNGSMKIDFKTKKDGSVDITSFRSADYELGNLNDYVGDENWYITFDVYNAAEFPIGVSVVVFSAYNNEQYGMNIGTIQPGTWSDRTKARIYINDLKERFTGVELNVLSLVFGFSGIQSGCTVYMDNFVVEK